ncbi:MAG TPA: zinc ribbon domain-containing protein [Candidatus Dormibacteraeota bacterium]|nr:zinc ribbon domain-containing protein [Candidatus Dormibacteraeota bacterium]
MIVCKNCGHQNEDNDTFCGSCGKFLEWTGERIAVTQPEPEPAPPPEPEPQPTHLGLIDRVKQAVGIEETAPQATTAPAAPPASVPSPATASAGPAASAPPSPPPAPAYRPVVVTSAAPAATPPSPQAPASLGYPPPATAAAPVSSPQPVLAGVGAPTAPPMAAPVAAPADEPLSRRPTSVAPAISRPRPAPRVLEPPTRRHPGDLICGQCGEGNDPVRHFCRRCGNSLDEAIAVQLPWYRRFFNRVFGVRTREAGWRPRRVGAPNVVGFMGRIVRLAIAAIIVVGLLAFLFVPQFHNLVVDRVTRTVTSARILVHPNYDPVYPTGTSATSSIAGHLPALADDRKTGTYWAALPSDHTPSISFHFDIPQDLADIGFTSGASGTAPADQFLAQPRPHQVHLVFSNGTSKDLTLADKDSAQFFPIDAKQVTSVEVHIVSMYPTTGAAPSSVAIDEVEFRIKD